MNKEFYELKDIESDDPLTLDQGVYKDDINVNNRFLQNNKLLITLFFCFLGVLSYYFFIILGGENDKLYEKSNARDIDYIRLEPITARLISTSPNKDDYIRIKLVIKPNDMLDKKEIDNKILYIRDIINEFLASLRKTDFDGKSNILFIKSELLKRVKLILHPIILDAVLIEEILIN